MTTRTKVTRAYTTTMMTIIIIILYAYTYIPSIFSERVCVCFVRVQPLGHNTCVYRNINTRTYTLYPYSYTSCVCECVCLYHTFIPWYTCVRAYRTGHLNPVYSCTHTHTHTHAHAHYIRVYK
jgi:hypothetical protein